LSFSKFTLFATFSIAIATLLSILFTSGFLVREDEDGPEVFALILSAAIGGMVMVQANDLIVMFLGLETLSLAFYLLTASSRTRSASGEAGLKYFVLGGFASAFFLYGVALVFGATGSTRGVRSIYGDMLLFYVPPVDESAKIVLLGATQGLISVVCL
jgi:NADH-quinone oxidoreductase subunit N